MILPFDFHIAEFDDPFTEWDARDAQAHVDPTPSAPASATRAASRRSRRARGDNEDTEEDIPQERTVRPSNFKFVQRRCLSECSKCLNCGRSTNRTRTVREGYNGRL